MTYHEGIPLTNEDLNRVDCDWIVIDSVSLNNRHIMSINRECKIGVTRDRDETETVSISCEIRLQSTSAGMEGDHAELTFCQFPQ